MATNSMIAIRPSRLIFAGLLSLAGAAMLSLAIVAIPLFVRVVATIGLVAVCVLAIRRHALLRSVRSIISIAPLPASNCIVGNASAIEAGATVLPESVAWPWMLLLHVAVDGIRWPVVILVLRDSVAEADWRRLSIWLRWQASEHAA